MGPTSWLLRVHYKPFVSWIWGGCLLMALGGGLAVTDRRYRVRADASIRAGAYGQPTVAHAG